MSDAFVNVKNTPVFRVAFPKVFKPELNELNGLEEFSLVALFPKDSASLPSTLPPSLRSTDLSELKAAIKQAAVAKWGEPLPAALASPLRDGTEKIRDDGTFPAGFEESYFITMKSRRRPGVIDQQCQDILDDSEFYGGCWARADVEVFAYEVKGKNGAVMKKGVTVWFKNLQKVADGEPFGRGRVSPQESFEKVEGASASTSSDAGGIFD